MYFLSDSASLSTMKKSVSGFTIVELLIVIVVIAILASISVVAFTGIQGRARDSERQSELNGVMKALEMYRAENGGYPRCGATGPHQVGGGLGSGTLHDCVQDELVPNYMTSVPRDPEDPNVPHRYYYANGYRKTSTTGFTGTDATDNYIIGASLDNSSLTVSGWGVTGLNHLLGSSN